MATLTTQELQARIAQGPVLNLTPEERAMCKDHLDRLARGDRSGMTLEELERLLDDRTKQASRG